jgi:hypothetical protein
MMKYKGMAQGIWIFSLFFLLFSCRKIKLPDEISSIIKSAVQQITPDENERAFYTAVKFKPVEEVKVFLKAGHSPDYMNPPGGLPWIDTNPLWIIDDDDHERIELFIKYGANVKLRPYIAAAVSTPALSEKLAYEMNTRFFKGTPAIGERVLYKTVELYLNAGADPLAKFTSSKILHPATDKTYQEYYEKNGHLAINIAIRQNLFSIVDLLLQNGASLDDQSLEYAKIAASRSRTNDMEEYITSILAGQSK